MNGPYVPIEDLAQHFSVSVSTIRGWIRRNQIPKHTYIRVGNTYRFSIDDVSVALSAPKPVNPRKEAWEEAKIKETERMEELDEPDEPDEPLGNIPEGNSTGIMTLDTKEDGPKNDIPHDFDADEDL
ncbi:MAG TPA: DNA-binding protein [Flavobacteriales bacterium]|nr:DNA-binding protein [Flavobacteriales bacterium]